MKTANLSRNVRFLLYLTVVVLINLAATTLFFRLDLTRAGVYSLSEASRQCVGTLSEPLTVKAFFTENLPAPYNNIERYLRDLLEEYGQAANRHFNYQVYNVSADQGEEKDRNRDLARDYGIHPVQIQNIDRDEVKFQNAFMGLVLIHGDLIEKIPAITSTDGLEYEITGKIQKMNNKISALLNLDQNVEVMLFLSSSLRAVGPYLNLPSLADLPDKVQGVVGKVNEKNYGKVSFRHLDPSQDPEAEKAAAPYRVLNLRWDDFQDRRGQTIQGSQGLVGLVVRYREKAEDVPVLSVVRIPLFGTQYKLMEMEQLETALNEAVENVIEINQQIGYLVSHGCPELGGSPMPGQRREGSLGNLNALLGETYSVKRVNLKEEGIPEGLASLIIAGPKENFSDHELYQLDQYLMQGRSLLLFLDAFREVMPQGQEAMFRQNQGPAFVPIHTGLEKLLAHYGLNERPAYVLDESCFKQRVPQNMGGGERPIYVAPIIKKEWINQDSSIMRNLKGLVMLKASPVEFDKQKVEANGLTAVRLFSSSDRSWEMQGRIDLNPMYMMPPREGEERRSVSLACVLEGPLPSYFADKPIPEKNEAGEKEAAGKTPDPQKAAGEDTSKVTSEGVTVAKGKPANVLLVGTSEILADNVLDEQGRGPNAQLVMNAIDVLNNREAYASMRTKTQMFNPLDDLQPGTRTLIKGVNIAGLPVVVVAAGLIVWFRRSRRKRRIQEQFRK